jgi:peptide/nickel transport system permease protein
MWSYIGRRLLLMVPTFLGITLACFFILRAANADPMTADLEAGLSGAQVSQEALEHLRATYDLDKPWYVQYLLLLERLVTLDLGTTWQDGRPIAEVIGEALPITLLLTVTSLMLAYLIAIPLGVLSAVKQHTVLDQVITVLVFMLYSLPSFWVGIMLIVFLSSGHFVDCLFTDKPGCFPLQGWHTFEGFEAMSFGEKVRDVLWHLVLPVVTLTYNAFAATSRYMRAGMLDSIRQDYIRTARAKGLSERIVIFRHALRNSLLPVITLFGMTLPFLISGAVVVESIFGIRGMGLITLEAIRLPDYPLVITNVAIVGLVTMVGILVSDILYSVADPRIRYDRDTAR